MDSMTDHEKEMFLEMFPEEEGWKHPLSRPLVHWKQNEIDDLKRVRAGEITYADFRLMHPTRTPSAIESRLTLLRVGADEQFVSKKERNKRRSLTSPKVYTQE